MADHAVPVIRATASRQDLADWLAGNVRLVEETITETDGLLLRGFSAPPSLARLLQALGEEPIPYQYRSSPRQSLEQGVYTASEYHSRNEISLHEAMSRCRRPALHLVAKLDRRVHEGRRLRPPAGPGRNARDRGPSGREQSRARAGP